MTSLYRFEVINIIELNYKKKITAIMEVLESEEIKPEIYDAVQRILGRNYVTLSQLRKILSSEENTRTLDNNSLKYHIFLRENKPHVIMGLEDSLVEIPCREYVSGYYELEVEECHSLSHEDLRDLVSSLKIYEENLMKLAGDYELELIAQDYGEVEEE